VVTTDVVSASTADHASLDLDTLVKSSIPKPKRLKVMDEFEEDSDGGVITTVTQYISSNENPTDDE